MKTLIICLDALGYDQLDKMKFLTSFQNKARLKTIFGYTGIEFSFFTGKKPIENDIWVEFIKKEGYFRFLKYKKYLERYRGTLDYIFALKQYLDGRSYLCKLHNIPFDVFSWIDVSTERNVWDIKNSYFSNKKYLVYTWPHFVVNGKHIIRPFFKENNTKIFVRYFDKDFDVYYIHLVKLDKTGHKFGVNSIEFEDCLKEMDDRIRSIVEAFGEGKIIIWSDHGMSNVEFFVDIMDLVGDFRGKMFIDSTICRFWDIGEKILDNIDDSRVIIWNEEMMRKSSLPHGGNHGETIISLKNSGVFWPNYYNKEKIKGMHGYPNLDGCFIKNFETPKELELWDCYTYI